MYPYIKIIDEEQNREKIRTSMYVLHSMKQR